MQTKHKTLLVLAVIAVLVGGYALYGQKQALGPDRPAPKAQGNQQTQNQTPAAATPTGAASGNIDDIVNDFVLSAESDQAIAAGGNNDAEAVKQDTEIINDFSGVYNENNF